MSTLVKITTYPTCKNINSTSYRRMIESLLYITTSRPDIAFSISMCARFQANLEESHLTSVKGIIKYLSATFDNEIWYYEDTILTLVDY